MNIKLVSSWDVPISEAKLCYSNKSVANRKGLFIPSPNIVLKNLPLRFTLSLDVVGNLPRYGLVKQSDNFLTSTVGVS